MQILKAKTISKEKVELLSFGGDGDSIVMSRSDLKRRIMEGTVMVTNMSLDKAGRLVKSEEKVGWLNIDLISYDVNNGICEVEIHTDNKDLVNEFMTNLERGILFAGDIVYTNEACEYQVVNDSETGKFDVIIRWIHIDKVVMALMNIPHIFKTIHLINLRKTENFAYMSDEQFYDLVNYLKSSLNSK